MILAKHSIKTKFFKLVFLLFMFFLFIITMSFYIANAMLLFSTTKWIDLNFFEFFSKYWINLDLGLNHFLYGSIFVAISTVFSIYINRECIFSKSCSKEPSNND